MGTSQHTLTSLLYKADEVYANDAAIIVTDGGPQLSIRQLLEAIESLSAQLKKIGVKPGQLVSLSFPNTIEFVIAFLGVTRARAVAAPLNSAYSKEEFKFYFQDSGASLVLLPAINPPLYAQSAASDLNLPLALVTPLDKKSTNYIQLSPVIALDRTAEEEKEESIVDLPLDADEALFLHTSGTTSRPKGVPLTHANLAASLGNIIASYELSPSDRTIIIMPLFHVHGLMAALLATLASGGTVLLPAGGKFSASSFWKDVRQEGVTWYTAVPTIHQILLARDRDGRDTGPYPALRFIRSCSASLAPAVLADVEAAFGAPVLEAYAMTEASHQMCTNPLPKNGPHKAGTVGRPTGIQLAVLDDEGQEKPVGSVGEVCIRGKSVTAGYRNNDGANKVAYSYGWFHTGDQGFLDEDGYLTLTGRIKELINRGGEKISPLEVDAALLAHPWVSEAVTFGAPDAHYGEVVNAAVLLHANAPTSVTEASLRADLAVQLAAFKIPKRIFFAKEIPRTATGKIQRRIVAQHFLDASPAPPVSVPPPPSPAPVSAEEVTVTGSDVAAMSLARLGVTHMVGVVGIPVTYLATAAQKAGIRYVGFRNEQSAGYAAGAIGYLTGVPGVLLTVSGPGCVHGLAGLSNATANTWPMIMVSGASSQEYVGRGDFQELDQCSAVAPFVKYAGRATTVQEIPSIVEAALLAAVQGVPGGTYVDLPSDVLRASIPVPEAHAIIDALSPYTPPWTQPPPPTPPPLHDVQSAASLLTKAQRPLIVIGKGAAYAHAEQELSDLIDSASIPFLPTPMGKGVLPDSHPLCASAARSLALSQADVVLVVGARLNWILHFGETPKWSSSVKFILLNIDEKEVSSRNPAVALVGDARHVLHHLNQALREGANKSSDYSTWISAIQSKVQSNALKMEALLSRDVFPLNFHCTLRVLRDAIAAHDGPSPILASEGANTMDIGRSVLPQSEPRSRLDAGTWGTMGVGLGYAISAALTNPGTLIIALEGDSAFGFSGMEVETIVRYKLPIVIIVMNNGGVYGGDRRGETLLPESLKDDPAPTSFVPGARYDLLMEAFGGKGYFVNTTNELKAALKTSFSEKRAALLNITIDPFAGAESGAISHRN